MRQVICLCFFISFLMNYNSHYHMRQITYNSWIKLWYKFSKLKPTKANIEINKLRLQFSLSVYFHLIPDYCFQVYTVQCTLCCSIVYTTVQCTLQYSVHYNTVYITVQCTLQYSVHYSTVYTTVQCTLQYSVN